MNDHPVLAERSALCALFDERGTDAPTWCGGWNTQDLAAHMWTRENRPDTLPGIMVGGPLANHTEQVRQSTLARPYKTVVNGLRHGPPWFWAAKWAPILDLHEWFVHHEDVRRANGGGPRELGELGDQLWSIIDKWGKIQCKDLNIGVKLRNDEGQEKTIKSAAQGVTLVGPTGELFLKLFGRPVTVDVEGDEAAVATFNQATFSA